MAKKYKCSQCEKTQRGAINERYVSINGVCTSCDQENKDAGKITEEEFARRLKIASPNF